MSTSNKQSGIHPKSQSLIISISMNNFVFLPINDNWLADYLVLPNCVLKVNHFSGKFNDPEVEAIKDEKKNSKAWRQNYWSGTIINILSEKWAKTFVCLRLYLGKWLVQQKVEDHSYDK